MLGQRAGSTVSVYAQVQCQEHKTGQQKVQFYYEDEIYCRSGYSLSMVETEKEKFLLISGDMFFKNKLIFILKLPSLHSLGIRSSFP